MKERYSRYIPVIAILAVFVLLGAALIGRDWWLEGSSRKDEITILENAKWNVPAAAQLEGSARSKATCLYLWDSRDEDSAVLHRQMPRILSDMRVGYREVDLGKEEAPDWEGYETVIAGFSDYQANSGLMMELVEWMGDGGQLMLPMVPESGSVLNYMSQKIGIMNSGGRRYAPASVRVVSDAFLCGDKTEYKIDFPYESALSVELTEACRVHITAGEDAVPLLWEYGSGEGKAVVVNLGWYDQEYRGIYAAAFSLLGDYCAWPVINGSAFYIDAFPFPLSDGTNGYITEVYGERVDLYEFYVQIWWKDLMELADAYGISFTASLLEENSYDFEPPFEEAQMQNRYAYFASMLINNGGELGLYGYSRLPLILEEEAGAYAEANLQTESLWGSREDMAASLKEAERFYKGLLSGQEMTVYVPPANLLSEEGLDVLHETLPQIRAVAGSYFSQGEIGGTEFSVDGNGMIFTPRITEGSRVTENGMLASFSELNLHYVNTHSIAPSNVVNADEGAEEGWPALLEQITEYEEWLAGAAPGLRKLNGSELAAAVQRFYYLDVEARDTVEGMELRFANFQDEAWLLVRFNEWEPDLQKVTGGKLEKLQGNLYLLEAEEETVSVPKKA